jgi:hypothetical protein
MRIAIVGQQAFGKSVMEAMRRFQTFPRHWRQGI